MTAVGAPVTLPLRTVASRTLSVLIRGYQAVRAGRPSGCRFWPSCSEYGLEAVERFGAVRGGWMALRRIGRCRPGGGYGVDTVPAAVGSAS